jgi:tRNA-specific 2-thiouridylase
LCNREIKFKVFLDYATAKGADFIATGHYAQKSPVHSFENTFQLKKAVDQNKDQTYFLYAIAGAALSKTLFPIGHLHKNQVRTLAQTANFANAAKKDSTGICFIGERKFKDFLKNYLPAQAGLIETPEGKAMGEHEGLMFYTLGQRQGLKIGGQKNSLQAPWYVLQKDLSRNVLIIGQGVDHPLLYADQLRVDQLHWIAGEPPLHPSIPLHCEAKIRYRQLEVPCTLRLLSAAGPQEGIVQFEIPQRAITPGQSVVFYQHDICLGGGIIQ